MGTKLYVGNLSYDTTEDTLRTAFSQSGTVVEVAMIKDRDTGALKGFAFVTMSTDQEAENAIQALNDKMLDGRAIKVRQSCQAQSHNQILINILRKNNMMKNKVVYSFLLAIGGLLLGGNVFADGVQSSAVGANNVAAQIEQISQKINELTAQINAQKSQVAPNLPVRPQLSQEKLDYIESEVKRIAKETARLKIEIEIFVTLREIEAKTAALSKQITPAAAQSILPPAYAAPQSVAPISADEQKRTEVEAQIAKIKQQIGELTQEMENQKAIESGIATAAQDYADGANEVDQEALESEGAVENAAPIVIQPAENKTETPKKGFWASVGDFLKKIFTF